MMIAHCINDLCKIVHQIQLRQNYKQYHEVDCIW